ncbi:CAP domain-containing protein [uncultured Hydrogenophaga sp.]|uniref:CAP domain-containing protein n=1 Tax=uncultured Hydrogenophaga sp. TaxID=199683 RepID=UPI00265F9AF8|nr:CAP domain-containing protein [uncultured Hydrogenophaga sp.]
MPKATLPLVAVMLCALLGGGWALADTGRSGGEPTAADRCDLPAFRASLLQAVNQARAEPRVCGSQPMAAAPPLRWERRLFAAARGHSADMARLDYMSHTGRDGRSVAQRVLAQGYPWSVVGENLAAGPLGVDEVVEGWLASPGHCINLMKRDFAEVAVACVQRDGTTWGRYWTMVLARE